MLAYLAFIQSFMRLFIHAMYILVLFTDFFKKIFVHVPECSGMYRNVLDVINGRNLSSIFENIFISIFQR